MTQIIKAKTEQEKTKCFTFLQKLFKQDFDINMKNDRKENDSKDVFRYIKKNDEIIGVSRIQELKSDNSMWQIRPIGILPELRGTGLGSTLLMENIQEAVEKFHIKRFVVFADSNAVNFYEKNGLKKCNPWNKKAEETLKIITEKEGLEAYTMNLII